MRQNLLNLVMLRYPDLYDSLSDFLNVFVVIAKPASVFIFTVSIIAIAFIFACSMSSVFVVVLCHLLFANLNRTCHCTDCGRLYNKALPSISLTCLIALASNCVVNNCCSEDIHASMFSNANLDDD